VAKSKKESQVRQKKKPGGVQAATFRQRLSAWWNSKNPILRFAFGFAVLMGIFYGFWVTTFFTDNILEPVVQFNAQVASKILLLFGYDAHVMDSTLSSPGIAIDVGRGCDAFEPMAIFLSAVLLFPAPVKTKLIGFATGIPILFVLNQLRIITLYMAGAHSIELFGMEHEWYFNLIHLQVWPVVFIVATLVLLAYWILYSLRQKRLQQPLTQ
jgi:exosortase/archaeosortase family protein